MRSASILLLAVLLLLGAGPNAFAQSTADDATARLEARRDAAVERAAALRAALAGERPLGEVVADLDDAVALARRLAVLAAERDRRDAERVALDALRDRLPPDVAQLRREVLRVEEEADALERRAVYAVLDVVADLPADAAAGSGSPVAESPDKPAATAAAAPVEKKLLRDALWLLGIAVFGALVRRRAVPAVASLIRFWGRQSARYHTRDVEALSKPAQLWAATAVELVTAVAALVLVPRLEAVIDVVLVIAFYQLLVRTAKLTIAAHPEVRPAVLTLAPERRELLLRGVRLGGVWLLGGWLLRRLVHFGASFQGAEAPLAPLVDDLAWLTQSHDQVDALWHGVLVVLRWPPLLEVYFWLGVLVVIWGLHVWEPHLRESIKRRGPTAWMGRWLSREHSLPLRTFYALAILLFLVGIALRDLLEQRGLRWLRMLAVPLGKAPPEPEMVLTDLPGELRKNLALRDCPDEWYVVRTSAETALDDAFARFTDERRPETVVLLGREGDGKRTLADRWCRRREEAGVAVVRVRIGERLTSAEAAAAWLAEAFGIENPPSTPEAFAGRLTEQLNDRVVLLEDLHLTFLRRVDGFAALRFLLAVMTSCQGPVFWLATAHRPAWRYLSALGGVVNVGALRKVVELEPLTVDELRQLLLVRTRTAGEQVTFTPLVAGRMLSWTALERARNEFFQRIFQASQGNPATALALWRKCLAPRQRQGASTLEVQGFPPELELPPKPPYDELFVLAAIHTHQNLTEDEIVDVTNMPASEVQAAVKSLNARGLLSERSKRFSITARDLVAVERGLRRHHILYAKA